MIVTIHSVRVPAMSTIGFLEGTNEAGEIVTLALDWRPARDIGRALDAEEVVEIEPESWMIVNVTDPGEETANMGPRLCSCDACKTGEGH